MARLVGVNSDDGGDASEQPEVSDRSTDFSAMRSITGLADSPALRAAAEALSVQNRLAQNLAGSPALRAAAEALSVQNRLAQNLAGSPALRAAAEAAVTWLRCQALGAAITSQAASAIRAMVGQIRPGIAKITNAIGQALVQMYRASAPPNWIIDGSTPLLHYPDAVKLALEEGIPLAWVPDPETVRLLMAVPRTAPGRSSVLRDVLEERADIILDYCHAQLDQITRNPGTPERQKRMVDVACQCIQALRADLPAPAQAAAANLIDQLLRELFTPIDGMYAYGTTRRRVVSLSNQAVTMSLSFLAILREMATLMPVPRALTEWWPGRGMELPETFSRHTTAHAVAEAGQVNSVNALIAIMLAVSLLCQEAASGWVALATFTLNLTAIHAFDA
jgi:hypothetical protein